MSGAVTDEMLMAFVDGELDAETSLAVAQAAERDPAVGERIALFDETRRLARDALSTTLREPVPQRLVDAARGVQAEATPTTVVPFRPRRTHVAAGAFAMAASLVLAVGLGYFAGANGNGAGQGGLVGDPALADALGRTPAGQTRSVDVAGRTAAFSTVGTFRVADGYCRTFRLEADGAPTAVGGVGCERGGNWTIDLAVAQPASGGDTFQPASGGALGSIDAYLDGLEAEGPLAPEEEPAAR